MGKFKRFTSFIKGLLLLVAIAVMLSNPEKGYTYIVSSVSLSLIVYSINQFIYYFSLARYMVAGKIILCKAFIVINLAIEVGYLNFIPQYYVMIYLVIGLIFTGIVEVLRAMETKNNHGVHWKFKLYQGIVTILISMAGLCFLTTSTRMIIYLYCIGLLSVAITKISEGIRPNSIVYVCEN